MEQFLEFDVIVYLRDDLSSKLNDLGIESTYEPEERIVKYAFDASTVQEFRATFVKYEGEYKDAVVVTFTENNYETPPLLISYNEFKIKLNEYYKKNIEAEQGGIL